MKTLLFILLIFSIRLCAQDDPVDLSIIQKIESGGNRFAINRGFDSTHYWDDSFGLYQITSVCLRNYNLKTAHKYQLKDLWDRKVNEEIARWSFEVEIPNQLRYYKLPLSLENKLIAYNAGIGNLLKNKINYVTRDYIAKYKKYATKKKEVASIPK